MRKIKYIMLFILSVGLLNSCVDDTTNYDQNDNGPNLAGFDINKATCTSMADNMEHTFKFKVKIVGPTVTALKNDVTLTFAADPSSTAILGTHYRIDNPTIVLKADNNYLGWIEIVQLTVGIVPPLEVSPVLVLTTTSATGDAKVLNNGKDLTLTLSYACYSNLAGNYDTHCVITRAISGAVTTYDWNEDVTETGVGEYRTSIATYDGYVNPGPAGSTPGVTFTDICGVATVPEQNLINYYSNIVVGTAPGTANSLTGVIHLEYSTSTTAAAGNRLGVYDMVRVP